MKRTLVCLMVLGAFLALVAVPVSAGDRVDVGDTLMVIEAMKMETAVAAPKAGTVTKVAVSEGDVVAVGDPLVYLD